MERGTSRILNEDEDDFHGDNHVEITMIEVKCFLVHFLPQSVFFVANNGYYFC